MRLWTLHPKHLDRQGLLAVWREALLAQAVLREKTKGYKNHPQLIRFKQHPDPRNAIAYFLSIIHEEATRRGFQFDARKYHVERHPEPIPTTSGQLEFEFRHLLKKLQVRSPADYTALQKIEQVENHPLFQIVSGKLEHWEKGA
jgi:hypothetical protein